MTSITLADFPPPYFAQCAIIQLARPFLCVQVKEEKIASISMHDNLKLMFNTHGKRYGNDRFISEGIKGISRLSPFFIRKLYNFLKL